ncbi:MAG: hypothetical protein R2695_01130 [Acidimicrobiales bacterium]
MLRAASTSPTTRRRAMLDFGRSTQPIAGIEDRGRLPTCSSPPS